MCRLFFVTIKRQAFLLFVFLDSNWHHMRFFRYIINLFISIWNRNKIILLLKRNSIRWVVACLNMLFFSKLRYTLRGTFFSEFNSLVSFLLCWIHLVGKNFNFIVQKGIYCYVTRNGNHFMPNLLLNNYFMLSYKNYSYFRLFFLDHSLGV